ncbi:MAG: 50S ribosomal protein L13 [Oscillospiraceae bacterium]|jgi:large subunit ribosomal protein L13|nr:50S ribosomal protein L13 [Oscillospiraceae bacterium]
MGQSFMPKVENIKRSWYIVDASGLVLGRLAAQVSLILRGKIQPIFVPHVDCGDYVIVINCDQVVLTGRKIEKKERYRHTGYIGHLKTTKYSDLMNNKPELAVEYAIKGMLPATTLGRKQFSRLFALRGEEHRYAAQKPKVWSYFRKVKQI